MSPAESSESIEGTPALPRLAGLRVMALESRSAAEMERLIQKWGGTPLICPSMREVPLDDNPAAVDFAHAIMTAELDAVIFLTGVGIRYFLDQIKRKVDLDRFLGCLADTTLVCRGPKPAAVLRELKLTPAITVPEPNTWRDLLAALDAKLPLPNCKLGMLEYGLTNPYLMAGLEARGAVLTPLKVYGWDLPTDIGPLREGVQAILQGQVEVLLFTSAQQAHNLRRVADSLNQWEPLREALRHVVIGSIGPTTTETLQSLDLTIDFSPVHPKMGHLVLAAAEQAPGILERKRKYKLLWQVQPQVIPVDSQDAAWNARFLKACRGEPTDRTPIWLMRQAGRYLPEYRAIREQSSFLELCKDPSRSAEVMITTVKRLDVDAAIIFSDLLPILEPMGMELEFAQGEGPVIHNPIRAEGDVDRFVELERVDSLAFVFETVKRTKAGLPGVPVIGFAGAPFTLASYAIEGGGSRSFLHTKTLMYRDEGAWKELMSRLARSIARYLSAQLAAGAHAVQVFDSWVGCLSPVDYQRYVLPYSKLVFDSLPAGTISIHFGTGNPALLPLMSAAGGTVQGIDWRMDLGAAWKSLHYAKPIQGNLDPLTLLADRATLQRQAGAILAQAGGRPGHIFNLGHGVLPQTPVDNVLGLIEFVRGYRHQ